MTNTPTPPKRSGEQNGRWRFTSEIQDELIKLIRAGNDRGEAAKRCKIGERTFKWWMQKGRANLLSVAEANEREPGSGDKVLDEYGLFVTEVLAAEAQVLASLQQVIFKEALGGNWRAALEILERRFPLLWSKRVRAIRGLADQEEEERELAAGGVVAGETVAAGLTAEAALSIEEKFLGIPRSRP